MKKIPRKPLSFDTLYLYTEFGRESDFTFKSKDGDEEFLERVTAELNSMRDNPIVLYGARTQAMFEYITVSLEHVQLIKSEDSGSVYSKEIDVRPVDFRIILNSGEGILVEVKNFRQKNADEKFKFTKKYFIKIGAYASLQNLPLKIAIYWQRMNIWTLVDSKYLASNNGNVEISFMDAVIVNEMSILGDLMIGTVPPLEMRIIPDTNKPRNLENDGICHFVIGDIQLFSGGRLIKKKKEKSLALSFMLLSNWEVDDAIAEVDEGLLRYFTFTAKPIGEEENGQPFQMLGYLSSMISRQYQMITTTEGKIKKIAPKSASTQLGTQISPDYKGETLHLLRFIMKPNPDLIST